MKIVRWSFENLHIPMIQDDEGKLWATTKTLAESLGVTEDAIRVIAMRNRDKLKGLSVTNSYAKDFIKLNKTELGIKRLRQDMQLWSESEMIRIALWSRSETADAFTDQLVEFVRKNATTGWVTREEHNELLVKFGQLAVKMENVEKLLHPDKSLKLKLVQ